MALLLGYLPAREGLQGGRAAARLMSRRRRGTVCTSRSGERQRAGPRILEPHLLRSKLGHPAPSKPLGNSVDSRHVARCQVQSLGCPARA